MIKRLFWLFIISAGVYLAAKSIPTDLAEKAAATVGLYKIKDRTIEILNPAARREQLLEKLQSNITAVKNSIDSPTNITPLIEESQSLISEIRQLNPKTGLIPQITQKILGLDNPTPAQEITPELKAKICTEN